MDLWVIKYASRGSRIGDFAGDSSPRALCFWAFWRLGLATCQGDCQLWRTSLTKGTNSRPLLRETQNRWTVGVSEQHGIACGHAMEADEMQPRTGNQRGESLHEFQR
jgi:hypothetical protein